MEKGINVIQLETASGAAIKSFEGSQGNITMQEIGRHCIIFCRSGINVPRRRFLPVKTTSDLLLVMSNLFTLNRGNLVMNPQRSFPSVPLVKLGDRFNKVVARCVSPSDGRCPVFSLGERFSFAFSKHS